MLEQYFRQRKFRVSEESMEVEGGFIVISQI